MLSWRSCPSSSTRLRYYGGSRIPELILRPQVAAFLDALSAEGKLNLVFEEIEVMSACGQAGSTIGDLKIRGDTGATVVAIRKPDGSYGDHPAAETVLDEDDSLIVLGKPEQIRAAEEIFAARERVAS